MKKRTRFLLVLAALLLVTFGYYAAKIANARNYTETVIRNDLASGVYPMGVADLSDRQLQILLKVEDPAFYDHHGIDLWTPGAGITTITQNLVKELYFDKFQPGLAKIEQSLIAVFALDPLVSKNDQLRIFLSIYHFASKDGQEVRGFRQAAQVYFGKRFEQLSEDEYISLVAMILGPSTFSVSQHPDRNAERAARIKALVAGQYQSKGLFDITYGKVSADIQKELLPFSYFEQVYASDQ